MFGGINDRKYIMEKLNKMARENLGIDYRVTDQSRLKYDSPIKNEKRFADSLEREMFHTERGPRNEKLLNNNGMSGYLDLIKSPMKNANIKTQNQQIQNVPQKQIIDKPKYVSNNVGSPNNASIKNRDQEEPMNDTSYNIAKAKFFGVEPDKTLTLKKDAKAFFGSDTTTISPVKSAMKQQDRNDLARSIVSNAGNMILRSQSVNNLSPTKMQGSPVSNQSAFQRMNPSPTQYTHKVPYYYSHFSMPKLPVANEINKKDDFDTKSTATYMSDILKKKKKIFGVNENTLNMMSFDPQCEIGPKRSLTLAPSTDLTNKGIADSTFVGRERDKYKDNTKEKIVEIVNNNKYHKKNDLSNYTYNAMTGRYY